MTAVPKAKRKAQGKRFAAHRSAKYLAFIRHQPCLLYRRTRCQEGPGATPTEACHVRTRGAGGNDLGNLWPGCVRHHQEQHAIGIRSFEKRYAIKLYWVGKLYLQEYERIQRSILS